MKKVNGVYGWVVDGVVRYVGSGKNVTDSRKSNHLAKLRKGTHTCPKLQELFDEVGEGKFEFVVLEECLIRDLFERERYYRELYDSTVYNVNKVRNTCKSKRTGLKAKRHKELFSELMSGESNPNCQTDIEEILAIKLCIKNGMPNKEIARIFGKSPSYVSKIKIGYRWADVEIPEDYVLYEGMVNELLADKAEVVNA